jgi:hypothetical protein
MIEVKITKAMKDRAAKKAKEMGEIRNSITHGEGNLAGFIGEEIANKILKGKIKNTYDYDIVTDEFTYDVKTKRCTSAPKPFYECSIAAYNIKQRCDRYIFIRVECINEVCTRAWVLGWIDKEEYFKRADRLVKGQVDKRNNYTVKADCFNLRIDELNQFEEELNVN